MRRLPMTTPFSWTVYYKTFVSYLSSFRGSLQFGNMLLILVLVFTFSRILFLDADPFIFKGIIDIGDEGYWAYEARNKVLFDEWISDDLTASMAMAPLYAFLSFVAFKSFGVHLFSARLVPAVAGILSVFGVYLIVREYNKRLAVIAAFIMAINNAFFMYNRIGHPESLVIFFLLLSFFFLTSKKRSNIHYLLAGVCFMLAILSKLTAVYFFPVIIFYFVALSFRKETYSRGILTYFAGVFLIAIPTVLFYYIRLFPMFKSTLNGLSAGRGVLSLILIPSHIFRFASNQYFSLPSIFLLSLLSIIYFRERKALRFFGNIKQNIKCLDAIELMAFSWFFGYLIGVLFSDFYDRRFTILIIPLTLFGSMVFDKNEKVNFAGKEHIGLFTFVILLVPFLNLLRYPVYELSNHINLKSMLEPVLPSRLFSMIEPLKYATVTELALTGILLLMASITAVLYATIFTLKPKYRAPIGRCLPQFSLFSLFLALLLNFTYRNSAIIEFFYTRIPRSFVILIATLLSISLTRGVKEHTSLLKTIVSSIYVVFCTLIIACTLFFPSFSITKSSAEMAKICNEREWIIGPLGHELSFENKLRPLWWIPNEKNYEDMNKDAMEKYRPKYYLRAIYWYWEGEKTTLEDSWPTPEQINRPLVYLDTFELWPVFGKPRAILELYRIDYVLPM